jgi:hypothetical protein
MRKNTQPAVITNDIRTHATVVFSNEKRKLCGTDETLGLVLVINPFLADRGHSSPVGLGCADRSSHVSVEARMFQILNDCHNRKISIPIPMCTISCKLELGLVFLLF